MAAWTRLAAARALVPGQAACYRPSSVLPGPTARGAAAPSGPGKGDLRRPNGSLCQDGGRAAGRRQRPLPRWRRPASGTRFPNPLEDVSAAAAAVGAGARPERRVAAAGSRHGLGGAAAASAPVRSWQALSPVGAQKLPPETLKQHSTTFPRVTKILVCAAQGRRPGHGVAPAPDAASWGRGLGRGPPARTPLPQPLS